MKFSCLPLRALAALAASCLLLSAQAQPVATPEQQAHEALLKERAQVREQLQQEIALQRQQLQARKLEGEKACWQRFAVEDCLRGVRSQAREQDNVLHQRELAINNEMRKEKADERLRAIAQKKSEKPVPAPVQSSVRGGETAQPAAPLAAPAVAKPPVDIAAAEAERAQAAQQRAAEQAARMGQQQADMANHAATEAERRDKVKKTMQDKQQAADARRASKADDIAQRKGAPLPIPEGVAAPSK